MHQSFVDTQEDNFLFKGDEFEKNLLGQQNLTRKEGADNIAEINFSNCYKWFIHMILFCTKPHMEY